MTNALAYFAVASETKNNKELSNALAYFESIIDEEKTSYNDEAWAQCYTAFYIRNLQLFIRS